MRKGMKMMLATQNQRSGGEYDRRSGRMEHGGEQMRYGGDRFEMRYERQGRDGEMRRGEIGYDRMNYGEDMRRMSGDDTDRTRAGEMRYDGDMRYESMENDGMEEMRRGRRRYKDGRFAPQSRYFPPEYGEDHWDEPREEPYSREMNNYPEQRRSGGPMSRIGFNMGGETHTGETLTFPSQPMMHKGKGGRLTKETAEAWVEHMENEDGTRGPHWKMEQTEQVRRQKGLDCDPTEFWVAMNAAYSDLSKLAKKYSVNNMDYYVDYVMSYWFKDKDAVPNKLAAYYENVVKK